jgi:hypothetical protein
MPLCHRPSLNGTGTAGRVTLGAADVTFAGSAPS